MEARLHRLISRLRVYMQCIWLFFPGLAFIAFSYYALTTLGQGRDIVTTIVESESVGFFPILAISFWACLTWYSTWHVAFSKKDQTYELTVDVIYAYGHLPRYMGVACFIIIEIAILHSPIIYIPVWYAALISIASNVLLILIGRRLFRMKTYVYRKKPYVSYGLTLIFLMLLSVALSHFELKIRLYGMFLLLLAAGMSFLAFANSRRRHIHKNFFLADDKNFRGRSNFFPVMLIILGIGVCLYVLTIVYVPFSRIIGPFNFFMLAFGVLVVNFNFVSWLSVRYRLNFHFLILTLVFVAGFFTDQYQVRMLPSQRSFNDRITLNQYFEKWYAIHQDEFADSTIATIPIFATLADGGASRSGYWVAQILGHIQDTLGNKFSDNLFMISGASGGCVGNATYFDLLHQYRYSSNPPSYRQTAIQFLEKDFLTFTISRMLNPFYFLNDRASALEKSMDEAFPSMRNPFSDYLQTPEDSILMPIFYLNTTRMQDSYPALISNIRYETGQLNNRLDVLDKLEGLGADIKLSTATVLSSRFPYMSPAGGIKEEYYVDGGYFDNSGAGVVHETFLAFEKFLQTKEPENWQKVTFNVLRIQNSKGDDGQFERVNPFVNDLFAPILVLAASYGQQTEINTKRLKYYIENRSNAVEGINWHAVSLYTNTPGEREYSMNWYMSNECRERIDRRFEEVLKTGALGHFISVFGQH